jgi:prophage DNA circulation protein
MEIMEIKNRWRQKWLPAEFRGALFFVENDVRSGGRRVALHQYPKRNIPYAEDMGRSANRFIVQGYLIALPGHEKSYLELKNDLITELEKDGPGLLRLPMIYLLSDVTVMVQSYSITESRERGGMCAIEMDFIEYGDPVYRPTISTPQDIAQSADNLEQTVISPWEAGQGKEAAPYLQNYQRALEDAQVQIGDIQITGE